MQGQASVTVKLHYCTVIATQCHCAVCGIFNQLMLPVLLSSGYEPAATGTSSRHLHNFSDNNTDVNNTPVTSINRVTACSGSVMLYNAVMRRNKRILTQYRLSCNNDDDSDDDDDDDGDQDHDYAGHVNATKYFRSREDVDTK